MANLSQSEIDALVAEMVSAPSASRPQGTVFSAFQGGFDGGLEEESPNASLAFGRLTRNYRLYDFRRPEKLSKDQHRMLRGHFGLYLRRVANYLGNLSRSNVDMSLVEVDQIGYKDIFTNHGVAMVLCAFRIGGDQGLLKLNLSFVFSLVERLMGGTGSGTIKPRPLTEFERKLCSEVFTHILNLYAELRNNEPVVIENVETDERLLPRSLSGDELMVRGIYDLRLGGHSGYLNMYILLRNLMPVLDGGAGQRTKRKQDHSGPLPDAVANLRLPVSVILGESRLPAHVVAALQPGSIITLDQQEKSPLKVQVGNVARFRAAPGLLGNRMAVTIVSRWEDR